MFSTRLRNGTPGVTARSLPSRALFLSQLGAAPVAEFGCWICYRATAAGTDGGVGAAPAVLSFCPLTVRLYLLLYVQIGFMLSAALCGARGGVVIRLEEVVLL